MPTQGSTAAIHPATPDSILEHFREDARSNCDLKDRFVVNHRRSGPSQAIHHAPHHTERHLQPPPGRGRASSPRP